MKIEVKTKEFLKSLKALEPITKQKQTQSILNFVLLAIKDGKATLTATNLEIHHIIDISAYVSSSDDLSIILPQKPLQTVLKQVKTGTFIVESIKETAVSLVKIISGKYEYKLPYDTSEDYPILPFPEVLETLELSGEAFFSGIDKINYVSKQKVDSGAWGDIGKAYSLVSNNKVLILTATNSHICAISYISTESISEFKQLISVFAIDQLKRSVEKGNKLTINSHKQYMSFICGDTTIVTRLFDLNMPTLQRILDEKPEKSSCTFSGIELCQIMKDIKFVYAGKEDKQVYFRISEKDLTVSCENSLNQLNMTATMSIKNVESTLEYFTICGDYVRDICKVAEKHDITWSIADNGLCYFEFNNSLHMVMKMEPEED